MGFIADIYTVQEEAPGTPSMPSVAAPPRVAPEDECAPEPQYGWAMVYLAGLADGWF